MIEEEEIHEWLVDAIVTSNMKQREIAKEIGLVQQSIAQYISGRALPSLKTFANLCIVLNLDANEILGINDYRRKNNINANIQ